MRVLLLILACAIGLSGYLTAAHAVADMFCDPVVEQGAVIDAASLHDHHAAAADDDNGNVQAKSQQSTSGETCLDCHHCCASHIIAIAAVEGLSHMALLPDFDGRPVHLYHGDMVFPLLRPPKSLV